MDTEKQRNFIIHFLYYSLLLILVYVFLRYLLYMIGPFLIGFGIAWFLRPLIHKLTNKRFEKITSLLVLLLFYALLALVLGYLLIQGFFYLQKILEKFPLFYQTNIEPYVNYSTHHVEDVWLQMDKQSGELIVSILDSLKSSLSSFIVNVSSSLLSNLSTLMTSIPNILLAFGFTILSSFFINMDYERLNKRLLQCLPSSVSQFFIKLKHSIKCTLKQLILAYMCLMGITFLELWFGLSYLRIDHAFGIAILIALFDLFPILGTGGILIPWILITWLCHQPKKALGLLILYMSVSLMHTILEPKIVGKKIGLSPLVMLMSMYLGGKLFGFMGVFTFPIVLLIAKDFPS